MLIVMLVVVAVLTLLFGCMLFMILNFSKKKGGNAQNDVMYMLERHETHLAAEIEKCSDDEKKESLNIKLRRIKAAQHLIEEMKKEDEARAAAIAAKRKSEKEAAAAKNSAAAPAPEQKSAEKPAQNAEKPAQNAEKPAEGAKPEAAKKSE